MVLHAVGLTVGINYHSPYVLYPTFRLIVDCRNVFPVRSLPLPPTKLGRYRTPSPLSGVRVSPLQLGAMSIGDKWQEPGMGSMDKESSFKLLDACFDAGVSLLSPLSLS